MLMAYTCNNLNIPGCLDIEGNKERKNIEVSLSHQEKKRIYLIGKKECRKSYMSLNIYFESIRERAAAFSERWYSFWKM